MLRNKAGPVFNFEKCVCVVFSSFCRENEIFKKNKRNERFGPALTLRRANIGPVLNMTAYTYIYIYIRCKVKNWSKIWGFIS